MITLEDKDVLIVDDTESNLDMLMYALQDSYRISVALDAESAFDILENTVPDLILLDVVMPGMSGFDMCRLLKNNPRYSDIPIIFLTVMDQLADKTKGFELGAVDYITKPFEIPEVKARVRSQLLLHEATGQLARQNELLEEKVRERTRELEDTQDITINSLAFLAEIRDNETGSHIRRTRNYIQALIEELTGKGHFREILTEQRKGLMVKSATLHDIGKVGIPDRILMKPGQLTNEEFDFMKKHTELGKEALVKSNRGMGNCCFLSHAIKFAYSHHEKWDGSGYPCGFAGEDIPLEGRLMAIADVYDALISTRIYKPPFSHSKACAIIKESCGTHFDPLMVQTFEAVNNQFRHIAEQFCDSEKEWIALQE